MANSEGHLVTADGTLLTNDDGTPVTIAGGGSILSTTEAEFPSGGVSAGGHASLAMPEGGIVVSATGGTIMTTSDTSLMSTVGSSLLHSGADYFQTVLVPLVCCFCLFPVKVVSHRWFLLYLYFHHYPKYSGLAIGVD